MRVKFIVSILLLIVPFVVYAENRSVEDVVRVMVESIKVGNSRCITIPGEKGVLRIYIESNKVNPHSIELVVIDYNGKQTSFQAGNNFLITQDDKLVFGKYDDIVYAKTYNYPGKEVLKIKYNQLVYDYSSKNIKVSATADNSFSAEEVLYSKDKSQFTIYKNNKAVKNLVIDLL